MKTIHISLDNNEFDLLEQVKGDLTWREFVLQFVNTKKVKP